MKATCPKCSQIIAVDDAKVPAGPFMLRCPKCQETMKMPGKAAAQAPSVAEKSEATGATEAVAKHESPPPPKPSPPPAAAQQNTASSAPSENVSETNTWRDLAAVNGSYRALLSLPDSSHENAMSNLLKRLGYKTDHIDVWDQKVEEIHQVRFNVIVTHRNGAPADGEKDLFKLLNMLPPETRRRIFVVLVGEEFTTGNGTQAFTAMADLVCHPQDLESADIVFRSTVAERARFYRSFFEIEDNL